MSGLGVDLRHALNDNLTKKIEEILSYLQSQGCPEQIHAGVILGSGLGKYTEALRITHTIPYSEIPSFPQSTVEGHSGALIFGILENRTIMVFSGRFHFYEGYEIDETVIPVRLIHAIGAKKLLISNAAGVLICRTMWVTSWSLIILSAPSPHDAAIIKVALEHEKLF